MKLTRKVLWILIDHRPCCMTLVDAKRVLLPDTPSDKALLVGERKRRELKLAHSRR